MPNFRDEGGRADDITRATLGSPTPAPPSPAAAPTLPPGPRVSQTPGPGQVVQLDLAGFLPRSAAATGLRVLTADPTSPLIGEFWYRSDTSQLCVRHDATTTKRVTLA